MIEWKKLIISTPAKILLASAVFAWLMIDGAIDFSSLGVFVSHSWLVGLAFVYWAVGPVVLASIRWRMLLVPAGYKVSFFRSVTLQHLGFFFTTALPGSLGGDLIKVAYLIRENPEKEKKKAFWSILLDRLIGMLGLFSVGAIFIALNFSVLWSIDAMRPLIVCVYLYIAGFVFMVFLINLPARLWDGLAEVLGAQKGLAGKVFDALTAFRVYKGFHRIMLVAIVLSVFAHGLSFVLFVGISNALIGSQDTNLLATVFPLGMLITTLPISPGGFGVGHYAFEQLFSQVGLSQGANIYNAYFVSQVILNLTGVVSYLLYKRSGSEVPGNAKPIESA